MAEWSKLIDMELSDEEKLDTSMPMAMPSKPDYPCGLRLCLTHKELEKLGLEANCDIGDMIDLRCFAEVTSISKNDYGNGEECRIELQITHMACEDEMSEGAEEGE